MAIFLFVLLQFTSIIDGREVPADKADSIIQSVVSNLNPAPQTMVSYDYVLNANKRTVYQGSVSILPDATVSGLPFHSVSIVAKDSSHIPVFRLVKADTDVLFLDEKTKILKKSSLFRLGSPLFGQSNQNTLLLYQYAGILADWKSYGGKVSRLNDHEVILEISIPEHHFFVRFKINESGKVVSEINQQIDTTTLIVYEITNFTHVTDYSKKTHFELTPGDTNLIQEHTAGGPVPGQKAPNWKLSSPDGKTTIELEDLKGRVVILDFWATWCAPCLMAMDDLKVIRDSYPDSLVTIIGITYKDEVSPFPVMKKKGVNYQVLVGSEQVGSDYGLDQSGIPALFIVDQNGIVTDFECGYFKEGYRERITHAIDQLLVDRQ